MMSDEVRRKKVVVAERVGDGDGTPRILVTNDDGIDSPGVRLLAAALADRYDVILAAPAVDTSGSGTAIGRFEPGLAVELRRVDVDAGVTAFSIAGPPGLAVTAAALGAFGTPPDLVVSGVNAGINTGHSIIHSGTVGAALTARTFSSRGLAVSLAPSRPWRWDTAVDVGLAAAEWLLARRRRGSILNVNVPALPLGEVEGARWADLDEFGHFRVATADVETQKLQFEIGGAAAGVDPASDTALCLQGYVTLTLVSGVEPEPFPDVAASEVWHPASHDDAPG